MAKRAAATKTTGRRAKQTGKVAEAKPYIGRVHPLAMETAMELAGGDQRRIKAESARSVLVLNHQVLG